MSVSPMNQSPAEWAAGRHFHLSEMRKIRSRALEFALAVERLEAALLACPHWEASGGPYKAPNAGGTYLCCSRVSDAQTACTAAYEALSAEVLDA